MAEEKQKRDWSKLEMGALWKKTNATQSFYSGKIKIEGKEFEIICFTNKHKTADNHPDIRIYLSQDDGGKEDPII